MRSLGSVVEGTSNKVEDSGFFAAGDIQQHRWWEPLNDIGRTPAGEQFINDAFRKAVRDANVDLKLTPNEPFVHPEWKSIPDSVADMGGEDIAKVAKKIMPYIDRTLGKAKDPEFRSSLERFRDQMLYLSDPLEHTIRRFHQGERAITEEISPLTVKPASNPNLGKTATQLLLEHAVDMGYLPGDEMESDTRIAIHPDTARNEFPGEFKKNGELKAGSLLHRYMDEDLASESDVPERSRV